MAHAQVETGRAVSAPSRSIGIFGGTFDPPHIGHLIAAERVREQMGLDEVRLVVANDPWQKDGLRVITRAEDRVALVVAALESSEATEPQGVGLTVSRVELDAGGPSFTIDTLQTFRDSEPDAEWFIVVGADAAMGLDSWHRAEELRQQAKIVVVNRPDPRNADNPGSAPEGWQQANVSIPAIEISSTELRERVRSNQSIRFLTPDPVIALIEQLGIYRQDS